MQALELNSRLKYRQDKPIPAVSGDEVLIRVKLAGICSTDLELVKGYAGFSGIIGHEFVGTVEAVVQEKHHHWLNKRVVGSINIGCGVCNVCRRDGPEHCQNRRVLGIRGHDGAFADYLRLPVGNLFLVPDEVPDEAAVFTEPLAAAIRVLKQVAYLPVKPAAVIGPGRLGLLIAKVLALAGYDVDVLGRSETSLALPKQWQLKTGLIQDVPVNHYDYVVDASGRAEGFKQALRIAKPRGTVVLKSTFSAGEPIDLSKVVVGELNILGSRCGPFGEALGLLRQGNVPVTTVVDGRYSLKDGLAALQHAAQPGIRKILLQP